MTSSAGPVWEPGARELDRSRLAKLIATLGLADVDALHRHAVDDPEAYWRTVVDDLGIRFDRDFDRVVDTTDGPEFPRWFDGGLFNVTTTCLDKYATGDDADKIAFVWEDEAGSTREISYGSLHEDVVRISRYLRHIGVVPGDRVAIYLPMILETAVAFLACARVGAVVVPAFSGYGPDALATRLIDSEAKVLVTADGFRRKGAVVPMKPSADKAVAQAPTVRTVLVVDHIGAGFDLVDGLDVGWADALTADTGSVDGSAAELDPNHPLLIAYTSGTTGRPKGIVLSHAGFQVKVAHDLGYCFDVQDDDIIFWITDMGWLVGPLLIVGALTFHATAVFYEGAIDHPDPARIWKVIDRHGVTVQGISPTAVRALMAAGDQWKPGQRPATLRAFVTTGEPWNPEPWMWLFTDVGRADIPILNYSGGTEISGGILSCYTILPLSACGFAGPVLGMDADVVDEHGTSLRGGIGELVVRNIWPGMTHSFWQDRERYLSTYWSQLPGVWWHGDLARIDDDGVWSIVGRSDDTIKVAGKRVGPAEVESAMVAHPAVAEAAAIGVPDAVKGGAIVCFVVPRGPATTGLEEEIKAYVGSRLGRALAPQAVILVAGLPKTKNNKILRRAISARYLGRPQGDLSSLDEPASLDHIPVAAAR